MNGLSAKEHPVSTQKIQSPPDNPWQPGDRVVLGPMSGTVLATWRELAWVDVDGEANPWTYHCGRLQRERP